MKDKFKMIFFSVSYLKLHFSFLCSHNGHSSYNPISNNAIGILYSSLSNMLLFNHSITEGFLSIAIFAFSSADSNAEWRSSSDIFGSIVEGRFEYPHLKIAFNNIIKSSSLLKENSFVSFVIGFL